MENEETPVEPKTVPTSTKVLAVAGDVLVLAQAAFVVKRIVGAAGEAIRNHRLTH